MGDELVEDMKKVSRKVGKYEVGRTIGEGTFAKVKFARNTETGESVAMKILAKTTILKHKMVDQVLQLFHKYLKGSSYYKCMRKQVSFQHRYVLE